MSTLKIRTAVAGLALLVAPTLLVACGSDGTSEPANSDQVTTTTSPDAMEEDTGSMTDDKDTTTTTDSMTDGKDG